VYIDIKRRLAVYSLIGVFEQQYAQIMAKRLFEKGSRLYQIGGSKYPSVTSGWLID
jgi:hypothetical protein